MNAQVTPTDLLRMAGVALYGERHWRSGLSRAAKVHERTIRRWAAGEEPIPNGAWEDIIELLDQKTIDAIGAKRSVLAFIYSLDE